MLDVHSSVSATALPTSESVPYNCHDHNGSEPDQGCIEPEENDDVPPCLLQDIPHTALAPIGEDPEVFDCHIEELQAMCKLIEIVRNVRLGDTHCKLGTDFVSQIRNPPEVPYLWLSLDI